MTRTIVGMLLLAQGCCPSIYGSHASTFPRYHNPAYGLSLTAPDGWVVRANCGMVKVPTANIVYIESASKGAACAVVLGVTTSNYESLEQFASATESESTFTPTTINGIGMLEGEAKPPDEGKFHTKVWKFHKGDRGFTLSTAYVAGAPCAAQITGIVESLESSAPIAAD